MGIFLIVIAFCIYKILVKIISHFYANFNSVEKKKCKIVFIVLYLFAFFIINSAIRTTDIGGVLEKNEYEEYYFINLYDYDTENFVGCYPGMVSKSTMEEEPYGDSVYGESYSVYSVESICIDGKETFVNSMDYLILSELESGARISIDVDGKYYYAQITTDKINKE